MEYSMVGDDQLNTYISSYISSLKYEYQYICLNQLISRQWRLVDIHNLEV